MRQIDTKFAWYDAWILLAILYNHERGPSSLQDILATADAINHAIPTRAKLNDALNRILAAGYIVEHEGNFAVTEAARAGYSKVTKPRTSMLAELERMENLLADHASLGIRAMAGQHNPIFARRYIQRLQQCLLGRVQKAVREHSCH